MAKSPNKPDYTPDAEEQTTLDKEKKEKQVARRKIAKRGTEVLHSLPSERECRNIKDEDVRRFVMALRNIALDATQANVWSDQELESFAITVAVADAAIDASITVFAGGDERKRSCAFDCKAEKDECLRPCHGEGWPCICCFDCRFAYLACLADCIL